MYEVIRKYRYVLMEDNTMLLDTFSISSDNIILYRYVLMEKDNSILLDIVVFHLTISCCTYRYVLIEDNTMLLDILVFLLTISYCTGMY
jgi:hypothetical protein